jgi:hypothetical protein
MSVHVEESFDDDVKEEEDKFDDDDDGGRGHNDEIVMTRQFLFQMNQRMMSLENEVKFANSRHNLNSGLNDTTSSTTHKDIPVNSPAGKTGYDMGESFQSNFSVHDYETSDLDGGGGRSVQGRHQQQQASSYNDRFMSNHMMMMPKSGRSVKKKKKELKKPRGGGGGGSAYDVRKNMRRVASVHVLR